MPHLYGTYEPCGNWPIDLFFYFPWERRAWRRQHFQVFLNNFFPFFFFECDLFMFIFSSYFILSFFFVCWMRVRDYAFGRLLIMFHSLVSFPLGKETSDSFIASVWILAALSLLLQRLLLLLLLLMRRILVLQPSSALLD